MPRLFLKQSELSALNGKCSVYFGWMQKLEREPALLRSCIMIRCRCAPTNVAIWLVTSIYNLKKLHYSSIAEKQWPHRCFQTIDNVSTKSTKWFQLNPTMLS